MSIKRGPDGQIIENPTSVSPATGGPKARPSRRDGGLAGKYDTPTVKPGSKPSGKPAITPEEGQNKKPKRPLDERTRIIGREDAKTVGADAGSFMDDPLVGWLVIVEGPGKGASLRLGYGRNTLGRAKENRLVCDFGDGEISRKPHCVVTYEPRGRTFLLQHGDGVNLTYLDDNTVLEPVPLKPMSVIEIGRSKLRFVPFCSPDWDWQDET